MKTLKRTLSLILSMALISVSIGNVQAAIISNDQIIHKMDQVNDRAALLQTINRADVQAQLSSMGVSSADIEARIDQMTHEEIAQLNQRMAELPAGAGVLGTVVLIFIVFVITDVIGATDIFPFIHPVR
jgi:hypothetical protein